MAITIQCRLMAFIIKISRITKTLYFLFAKKTDSCLYVWVKVLHVFYNSFIISLNAFLNFDRAKKIETRYNELEYYRQAKCYHQVLHKTITSLRHWIYRAMFDVSCIKYKQTNDPFCLLYLFFLLNFQNIDTS